MVGSAGFEPATNWLKASCSTTELTAHFIITVILKITRESFISGVPKGIRTPVTAVKGRCPRPLDDRDFND